MLIMCLIMILLGVFWGITLIVSFGKGNILIKSGGFLTYLIGNIFSCSKLFELVEYQKDKTVPVLFLISSSFFAIGAIYYVFKRNRPDLTFFSFAFGMHHEVENYKKELQIRVDNDLNIKLLEKRKDEIEIREKNIVEKEHKIYSEKEYVETERKNVQELSRNLPCLHIPIGNSVPICENFVQSLPKLLRSIWKFYVTIDQESRAFTDAIKKKEVQGTDREYILAFFKMICLQFCAHFFNDDEARMHFRILKDDSYIAFASMIGNVHDLPKNFSKTEGVFRHLANERRCIVKSKNPDVFAAGNNPNWEDALSGAFDKYLTEDKYPIITFGISIKFSSLHSHILYFLSFIRVEELLSSVLDRFEKHLSQAVGCEISIVGVLKNGQN